MATITIRNIPEDVHRELVERAKLHGQSLQEYLLEQLIEISGRPDVKVWLAQLAADKAANPVRITAEEIVSLRDSERP